MRSKRAAAEMQIFDHCKATWGMYLALKYAPEDKVKPLWDLLSPEQQKLIKNVRSKPE